MTKHQSEIHISLRETLKEKHTVPDGYKPASGYKVFVATAPDGSQTMVNIWADGRVTVADREHQWLTWGPPRDAKDMTWGES